MKRSGEKERIKIRNERHEKMTKRKEKRKITSEEKQGNKKRGTGQFRERAERVLRTKNIKSKTEVIEMEIEIRRGKKKRKQRKRYAEKMTKML